MSVQVAAEGDALDPLQAAGAANITELASLGKSVSKHSPVDPVPFDLPLGIPAGGLESDIESADPCKQASECLWLIH
jgi:hypothetical protein